MLNKKIYKIVLIACFLLFEYGCVLLANEQLPTLTQEDKEILQSDDKEKTIKYLKDKIFPYQTDIKERSEYNRQKLIALNAAASKHSQKDVRIAAFWNLAILGAKEYFPNVLSELRNAVLQKDSVSQEKFLETIALYWRHTKVSIKEEIEKTDNDTYCDLLLDVAMRENYVDDISSDTIYKTVVRNMNSQETHRTAQKGLYFLAERNYKNVGSLIESFEKSNIQENLKGEGLIYPLRRSAHFAKRMLEFTGAEDKESAIKNMFKSLNYKNNKEDKALFSSCLQYIQKHKIKNLLPTIENLRKDHELNEATINQIDSVIENLKENIEK